MVDQALKFIIESTLNGSEHCAEVRAHAHESLADSVKALTSTPSRFSLGEPPPPASVLVDLFGASHGQAIYPN